MQGIHGTGIGTGHAWATALSGRNDGGPRRQTRTCCANPHPSPRHDPVHRTRSFALLFSPVLLLLGRVDCLGKQAPASKMREPQISSLMGIAPPPLDCVSFKCFDASETEGEAPRRPQALAAHSLRVPPGIEAPVFFALGARRLAQILRAVSTLLSHVLDAGTRTRSADACLQVERASSCEAVSRLESSSRVLLRLFPVSLETGPLGPFPFCPISSGGAQHQTPNSYIPPPPSFSAFMQAANIPPRKPVLIPGTPTVCLIFSRSGSPFAALEIPPKDKGGVISSLCK